MINLAELRKTISKITDGPAGETVSIDASLLRRLVSRPVFESIMAEKRESGHVAKIKKPKDSTGIRPGNVDCISEDDDVPEGDEVMADEVAESDDGHWMKKAFSKHKGKLHDRLHVAQGDKIPVSKLRKASHSSDSSLRHEAQAALNARKSNEDRPKRQKLANTSGCKAYAMEVPGGRYRLVAMDQKHKVMGRSKRLYDRDEAEEHAASEFPGVTAFGGFI